MIRSILAKKSCLLACTMAFALAAVLPRPAAALDLRTQALFGNMNLDWKGETSMTQAAYPGNLWVYGARIGVEERIGTDFLLETYYETDPILRHILRCVVAYESGIIKISAGPILGAFNTMETPIKAGISVGMRVDLPGMLFAGARADSSMGAGLIATGDYAQELAELTLGWYVYNAICSVNLLTRKFYRVTDAKELLADSSNRYAFSVDVHKKGAPYRVKLDLGYQDLSRSYPSAAPVDRLGILFIGTSIQAYVSPTVALLADFETSAYAFGLDGLEGQSPASTTLLFRAGLGMSVKLGKSSTRSD